MIRRYLTFIAIAGAAAFSACGGCDDTQGGAADGTSCERDNECAGECGEAGFCIGGDDNNGAASNNGSGSNNGTGTNNNGTGTNNNGTGTNNNGTGTNNGTGGLPDGSMCVSDAECAQNGICNSDNICVGGGLPDGSACQADTECAGFCNSDTGLCEGAATGGPFDMNGSGQVLCGSEPCQCDNGMDDDGDGLIDGQDPECTGPYDNDEGSFATGIPGDNKDPKWQDCFFDGNSGAGDDGCRYHTDCLTGDLPQDDADCSVSQECFDYCRPLTPNGCDCFGCCEVATDSGSVFISIGSDGCSTDNLDACNTCVQTEECVNTCGDCELCYGKTIQDLPAYCSDGPGLTSEPCVADSDCRGICGGNNTCEGYGEGGFTGDECMSDLDCRGVCGGSNTCEGFGGDTGFDGDACESDTDCRGTCGGDATCTGDGGSKGFDGDACVDDTDCRGTCGGDQTCDGYGSGGGYDGDACASDNDCRGTCGGDGTCTGSGSGSGSGVQCDSGETPCEIQADCQSGFYCSQGCCLVIPG